MTDKVWDNFYKTRGRFFLRPHEFLAEFSAKLKLYNAKSILDLGAGSGRNSIYLAKEGFKVTAVDFSEEAIDLATKWAYKEDVAVGFKKINFHTTLPFSDNKFDAVLAIDSLHYNSTEELKSTFNEIHRILKRQGLFFFSIRTKTSTSLVSHLNYTEEEIKEYIKDFFSVSKKFKDKEGLLCFITLKK